MHTVGGRSYSKSLKPQLYPVDGRPGCMFSLCMHPAIFMSKHRKITFVSQGAHWRTDAHNGKPCLLSVLTETGIMKDFPCGHRLPACLLRSRSICRECVPCGKERL